MKKRSKLLFYTIFAFFGFILIVGGLVWFAYSYLPAQNLQRIINASDWEEHRDTKLGYTYIVPHSWTTKILDDKENSPFDSDYVISSNAYPQALISFIFYKNPKKEKVKYLLDGSDPRNQVDPHTRTINGIEYIVIHYPPRLRSGFKAGNYLLAKDYSLLVEARLEYYPSELTSLEEKKEEEIVNKTFNSIKKQ